jgi:hypothetical protein
MAKAITGGVAAAVMLALLLAACSSGRPAAAPVAVRLTTCGYPAQQEPSIIQVVCQTDDITARNLRWSAWGKPVATAIGTGVVDLCAVEDCHTGLYQPVPLVIVASKVVRCPHGRRAYSRLQYLFVGRSPFRDVPAHVSFSHFMTGAGRPGLPVNQTVSLTC